jgi:hypothetical protein
MPSADFTREDFQLWADHPITQWVSRAYGVQAKELHDQWVDASWSRGVADKDMLISHRAQAVLLERMGEPTYDSICDLMGQEPKDA